MAPSIEAVKTGEQDDRTPHFVVDLTNDEPLNITEFENLAKKLHYDADSESSLLRFIVIADKMYLFPKETVHEAFYRKLFNPKDSNLQCAGKVIINYWVNETISSRREVGSYSSTLADAHLLPKQTSEEYKNSVLKPKLGKWFKVTPAV